MADGGRAQKVTCIIMGGGAGSRLYPLTRHRAKPAVPVGGKFRLIDIPISNCINSGLNRIYILTQFNSTPLHRHISESYRFDRFSGGFVEILAAQQTPERAPDTSWYQGTADAVRKNLERLRGGDAREVLILSGDQLYRMDFREILETHRGVEGAEPAGVTIGAVLVPKERARDLGVLRASRQGDVEAFIEKPGRDERLFAGLEASRELLDDFELPEGPEPCYLANMGIYVFDLHVLDESLASGYSDFGKEVLPSLLGKFKVRAHLFRGYWEDIGTIGAFHRANLDLAGEDPCFDFYDEDRPVYTRARQLPAARLRNVHVRNSLVADGALVGDSTIEDSLIGLRSIIGKGCAIRSSYVMGARAFETADERRRNAERGVPDIGVGERTVIQRAIIDVNARIGRNVRIVNEKGLERFDDGPVIIRDGIAVVPRDGVVPEGYVI